MRTEGSRAGFGGRDVKKPVHQLESWYEEGEGFAAASGRLAGDVLGRLTSRTCATRHSPRQTPHATPYAAAAGAPPLAEPGLFSRIPSSEKHSINACASQQEKLNAATHLQGEESVRVQWRLKRCEAESCCERH